MKHLRHQLRLRPRTLFQKTIFLFGVSVTIPLVLLVGVAWLVYALVLLPDYETSMESSADQTIQDYNYRASSYEFLLSRISADANLQTLLATSFPDPESRWTAVRSLNQTLESFGDYLPGLTRLKVFYENPTLPEDGDALRKPGAAGGELSWYRRTMASENLFRWDFGPAGGVAAPTFRVTRQIRTSTGDRLGLVWAQIDGQQVWGGVVEGPSRHGHNLLLLDPDLVVLDSSWPDLIGQQLTWTQVGQMVSQHDGRMIYRTFHRGWILIQISPKSPPLASVGPILLGIGIVAVFLVVLDGLGLLILLQNLRRRLATVSDHMGAVSSGDFVILDHDDSEDEVGEIERSFNQMSARLDRLMDEVVEARMLEREESFRALQAQINPHFLYNSLGVLRWMALDGQSDQLCEAIDALALFYRITLKDKAGFIPMVDEVSHARAYLEVQKIRYRQAVTVEWDVDPAVEPLFTIKLILQPLVENCYSHGRVFQGPGGKVRVQVKRDRDWVRLSVEDNGLGMAPEILASLENGSLVPSGEGGYGIANILGRLRLCFGTRAWMEFSSIPRVQTTVTAVFPACSDLPDMRSIVHGT